MPLIVFSFMLSFILGCAAWLVLGEKFPWKEEDKWPALNNIVIYGACVFPVVYTFIFLTF